MMQRQALKLLFLLALYQAILNVADSSAGHVNPVLEALHRTMAELSEASAAQGQASASLEADPSAPDRD